MLARVEKLRERLSALELDGFLVGHGANRRYLSGFTGSEGWLLVTREKSFLCTDFRYLEQAGQEAVGWEIVRSRRPFTATLAPLLAEYGLRRVGFEEDYLSYRDYRNLVEKTREVQWVPCAGHVEALRRQKDDAELAAIKRAAQLDDRAFAHILSFLKPGLPEREIALELELFARRHGGTGASFAFIVASGPRAALPHGVASNKLLQEGEFVIMDYGTVVDGYHSDFTRTVVLGKPTPEQVKVYRIVQEAQAAAIAAVAPGRTAGEVDAAARKIIVDHGYGDYFGHGTGHGVGLCIHEEPHLTPGADTVLLPGMVLTIEPGIYLPGWGGVRIEDLVVVTERGCEVLNQSHRELVQAG
ncbi:MAG TPA: aminopeptidase P family protein [Firmicutes bacterium]|nr:aminopeptidase P family protein [Bacillota bacterium]